MIIPQNTYPPKNLIFLATLIACLSACDPTDKWTEGEFLDYGNIDENNSDSAYDPNGDDSDFCNFIFLLEHRYSGANHESHLWKFKPEQGVLIDVGELDCPYSTSNDYLIAMTANRDGIMWFVSNTEKLFWADPNSLECYSAGISAQDESIDLRSRSLAFMREDANSPDVLFLGSFYGWGSPEQAVLTKVTDKDLDLIAEIDGFTGYSASLELAGTSDGRLYGQSFGLGENSRFIEIDPKTADVIKEWELPIETGSGFTFATWKDDVWFFPSTGTNGNAEIYTFDPDNEDFEYLMELPYTMVGSAAPTCADENTGS